ncbi:hydantoinase B/oxoprolinase family protein [Paraburkholderia xenovorans LB400]|uniref:5-oxoprolinase (ATP-hydrolyzing) n=1 Tax=Paraburkholderia xenovorans (strain LB400) TaxID=266265 RepID=Q13G63_PARXL|nr:hydantoinase B/oxoprolinase family protein [Paraburkholderia xenovorans]ABE36926.1 5-oxoprolinase (ATP-hydrolyzing) [Paraburkholderia xenovorans LB400]AIP35156.1 hydantoinase B/oxoprolinase family protein [Paraburkholderia xenovorans LB400]
MSSPVISFSEQQAGSSRHTGVDPITVEIIRHALTAIPAQIDSNIVRTAYSPLIYEYKDYAVGIVDHEGNLLSQSQGALPIFVANALGVAVRDGLSIYGATGFRDGDLVFSNHSGTLGQHLNNVVMYAPIFVGEHKSHLFGFMAVISHWMDVGGLVPGSISPFATEIFQEGVQYRSLKLAESGVRNPGVYKTIECNTRFPREVLGDMEAQAAGCVRGAELVAKVIEKYGLRTSREAIDEIWEKSEQASRAAIRAIPDGVYSADSFLDDDGLDLETPIAIGVDVHVSGDTLTVDFSRTHDEVRGAINSGREGGALAAARIAFKYLIEPHEPANEGAFRPLKVVIPDGKFISASANAAMGSYSGPLPTVVDTILKALAPVSRGKVTAGHHGTFGAHIFTGRRPETGERYQHIDTAVGGWGATSTKDGVGPYKSLCHGDTLDVPVEVQEALYPLMLEEVSFRVDSGGAGKTRGGVGVKKRYRVLSGCVVTVMQDRKRCPPWGVGGGLPGAYPTTLHERDGSVSEIRKAELTLVPGDMMETRSGGGGGCGNPFERSPELVSRDVQDGFVSVQVARTIYGVVLREDCSVDVEATAAARRNTHPPQ